MMYKPTLFPKVCLWSTLAVLGSPIDYLHASESEHTSVISSLSTFTTAVLVSTAAMGSERSRIPIGIDSDGDQVPALPPQDDDEKEMSSNGSDMHTSDDGSLLLDDYAPKSPSEHDDMPPSQRNLQGPGVDDDNPAQALSVLQLSSQHSVPSVQGIHKDAIDMEQAKVVVRQLLQARQAPPSGGSDASTSSSDEDEEAHNARRQEAIEAYEKLQRNVKRKGRKYNKRIAATNGVMQAGVVLLGGGVGFMILGPAGGIAGAKFGASVGMFYLTAGTLLSDHLVRTKKRKQVEMVRAYQEQYGSDAESSADELLGQVKDPEG